MLGRLARYTLSAKGAAEKVDNITPVANFRDSMTADHKILCVDSESTRGYHCAFIVQDECTNTM